MIAATAFVLGLAAVGGSFVYADTSSTTAKNNPMNSLVSAIATKFNLNSSDVQTVVNDVMKTERSTRETQEKVDQATKLAKAVTDGKLTQTQVDLISVKLSEMETEREANRELDKDLTKEERKIKMETERETIKEWATSNNIPVNFLQLGEDGRQNGGERNNKAPEINQ